MKGYIWYWGTETRILSLSEEISGSKFHREVMSGMNLGGYWEVVGQQSRDGKDYTS